jgi:hypothetical protein
VDVAQLSGDVSLAHTENVAVVVLPADSTTPLFHTLRPKRKVCGEWSPLYKMASGEEFEQVDSDPESDEALATTPHRGTRVGVDTTPKTSRERSISSRHDETRSQSVGTVGGVYRCLGRR